YLNYFRMINQTSLEHLKNSVMEKGYIALNRIIGLLFENPQSLLVVTTIIVMTGFCLYIYNYSNNIWLSLYLLYILRYIFFSMSGLRQAIALVIILYSYKFLCHESIYKFIFIIFIASLFHRSALVFLLAWLGTKLNYNR